MKFKRLQKCLIYALLLGAPTSRMLPVAIVAVASIAVATAAVLLLFWWYRKRQKAKLAANQLLADMESSPTSVPYQEEPITSDVACARPVSTTVIQNTLYRDSVVIDDGTLDPVTEDVDSDNFMVSGDSRQHKHKHRKQVVKGNKKRPNQNGAAIKNVYKKTTGDLVDINGHGGASEEDKPQRNGKVNGFADEQNRESRDAGKHLTEQTQITKISPPPPQNVFSPTKGARSKIKT
jgi:hypothetical protein